MYNVYWYLLYNIFYMTFSRSHTGMIGIISLFTGMIAPVIGNEWGSYPFPLTSLQVYAYIILFLLSFGFYVVSVRRWYTFRLIGIATVSLITYMAYLCSSGNTSSRTGELLTHLQWGWVFIIVGVISLLYVLFVNSKEEPSDSIFSDAIIGITWTLTLIGLTALIIAASIDNTNRKDKTTILEKNLGWTHILTQSGITISPTFTSIKWLQFKRKNDTIRYYIPSATGITLFPESIFYTGTQAHVSYIWETPIVSTVAWTWEGTYLIDPRFSTEITPAALIIWQSDTIEIKTSKRSKTYTGTSVQKGTLAIAEWTNTFAWITKTLSGYAIQKDWVNTSESYRQIQGLSISKSGYDTIALAQGSSGELMVIKNGIPIENIRTGYREGSWKSNGSHSIYVAKNGDIWNIIYDGVSIGKEFDEVREVFLEKNGNSYAFFARPKWEKTYCLFTRFRWNLCGLTGYMNPQLGADGNSIIYAGLYKGIWGIYRNTDTIIQDTWYSRTDISHDYVFFDITNPKQYVFLEYTDGEKYQIRKNWKIIPWIWDDVWLDVTFWYDNKVIMTVQDTTWWRIIEF